MTTEAHEFTRGDITLVAHLAERVSADVEWFGARLLVEVYDRADTRPIAWIEMYPGDSDPTITFTDPRTTPRETDEMPEEGDQ